MAKKMKIVLIALFLMLNKPICFAQGSTPLLSGKGCIKNGNCTLDQILSFAGTIANFILGIVGSLALLFFIYGGVMMLISAGSSDRVNKGKTILKNAIIGLVIVFASWLIIKFVYQLLGIENWKGTNEFPKTTSQTQSLNSEFNGLKSGGLE